MESLAGDLNTSTTSTMTTTVHPLAVQHNSQSVFIGAGISIGGNMLISVAMNVQRFAHVRQKAVSGGPDGPQTSYLKNWIWWIGLSLMILGELGNFSAYSFAPASVVAPLGMTTVLANAAVAVIFLKETLHKDDIVGAFMAVSGAFLIINFCGKEEPVLGLTGHVLVAYLKQPALVTYLSAELLAVALLWYIRETKRLRSVVLTLVISALIGSWTVISAKAVSGLLRMTFQGNSQLGHPLMYIMVVILVATAIMQVKFLTQAMINNPATVVVPTNFVFFTVSAIVAGVIFYQEFRGLGFLEILMFAIGCCLCFAGVWFITLVHETPVVPSASEASSAYIAAPSLFGLGRGQPQFVIIHENNGSESSNSAAAKR